MSFTGGLGNFLITFAEIQGEVKHLKLQTPKIYLNSNYFIKHLNIFFSAKLYRTTKHKTLRFRLYIGI